MHASIHPFNLCPNYSSLPPSLSLPLSLTHSLTQSFTHFTHFIAEEIGNKELDQLIKCDTSFAVELGPLVDTSKSDSANLDSILELYNRAGKSPQEAVSILVPPAWENGRIEDQLEALRASGGDDAAVSMKRAD